MMRTFREIEEKRANRNREALANNNGKYTIRVTKEEFQRYLFLNYVSTKADKEEIVLSYETKRY